MDELLRHRTRSDVTGRRVTSRPGSDVIVTSWCSVSAGAVAGGGVVASRRPPPPPTVDVAEELLMLEQWTPTTTTTANTRTN